MPTTRPLDRLREAVLGNLAYKLLAAAFAIMVWIWVQSEQVVEQRARVRLDWVLPQGLTFVETPLQTATVTVEGVQAFARAIHQRELSISLDLSRAREGEVDLDLSERPITGLPSQVRVVSISPSALKLRLDRVQKRRLPVVPATRGEPAEGFRVASLTVLPEKVELRGPSTVLRAMEDVQTDPVDLAGLREDAEFQVGLAMRQGPVSSTSPTTLTVTVDLEPVATRRRIEEVPLLVRAEGWAAATTAVTVMVEGPASLVTGLDPKEFSVVAQLPEGWAEPKATARLGAAADAPVLEVVHPGGDDVEIVGVEPAEIELEKR